MLRLVDDVLVVGRLCLWTLLAGLATWLTGLDMGGQAKDCSADFT
jgi:hypothetical protein